MHQLSTNILFWVTNNHRLKLSSMTNYDDIDTEDNFGELVPERSRCEEEDKSNESSDDDMHNDIEYIFFESSAESETDEDE